MPLDDALHNWSGTVAFGAARIHRPTTVDELRRIVAGSQRARALGSAHSFNRIADTDGDLISVAALPQTIEVDRDRMSVTVSAGLRYGEIGPQLTAAGVALHNYGSLPHISIAGATATGTHGSGMRNGNLATAVSMIEMVTADGSLVTLTRDDPSFAGAVVSLGALGIVTRMTLDVVPAFTMEQFVYDDLPGEDLRAHLDDVLGAAYSVSLFTDWRMDVFNTVWLKARAGAFAGEPMFFGGTLADGPRHPLPGVDPVSCTVQGGVAGPSNDRLPHFKLEFTPSSGEEIQTEYLLPHEHALAAIAAVAEISPAVAAVLQISEVRTIAADDLWLSGSYGRDSVALHFTWIKDAEAIAPVLVALEQQLAPFDARPHWGKVFDAEPAAVAARYERYDDFRALMHQFDPDGVFRNDFLDRYFPAQPE